MALAAVRDLREFRDPVSAEELEQFETDVLAGFILARASAGLAGGTIRGDVGHLDQMRTWFGRPLWDMEPADADEYFGKALRGSPSGTRLARAQALTTYFLFLELRHKVEIHWMTGRVLECPIDEMNRPRGSKDAALRIPPTEPEIKTLFTGWGGELATCRKFAPHCTELHRVEADVAGRTQGERGMQNRPGRHQVGPGPLRQAPCAPRQGRPRLGPARADGAADQRCRSHAALVPLVQTDIDEAIATATTPDIRLIIALAAIHAARPKTIRTMKLDDVDLGNRRITIGGHVRPLDDLTRRAVLDWLDHRRNRWPNTANPHLNAQPHRHPGTAPCRPPARRGPHPRRRPTPPRPRLRNRREDRHPLRGLRARTSGRDH
ncbi:hypothetical protein [Streptomyces chiangmaiensis]|uniref:Uncharacterized protein n=1 Tax=Streptomyces chiangmaiensis TaxID=766497 RepID=A0ABU7FX53_9ACTN|nr:hypothetical protein [Streptomyces chiangmaiensis]MED7827664.1 hypothetical protein [Streptomyces chiangmaiensis]